jgi:1-acyl-sn-glycerol-3-phosphate acyltransferase
VAAFASALVWVGIGVIVVAAFLVDLPLFAVSMLADPRRRALHAFHGLALRTIVRINPFWNVRVIGPDRPPPGVFVVCANHQSNADVFCLSFVRGQQWRYLAKRSLLRIPVFGWLMQMGGHVAVERGERASGEAALARCRRWLERGVSVVFFPEGTRSETGDLREFKMGAFTLAVQTGTPILPVALTGTMTALPKHGWVMRDRADVRIRLLDPIEPGRDPVALRDRTRAAIAHAKAELEGAAVKAGGAVGLTPEASHRREGGENGRRVS